MAIPFNPLPGDAMASGAPATSRRRAAIDPAVLDDIRQASRSTDVDFSYLVAQAGQESGFDAKAKSPSSSASGLFQFIGSTWLDLVRQHGAKYGLGDLARQITTDAAGRPAVADPAMRARILGLRDDPRLSAALAAEFARSNKDEVERALGRPANATDLYLAHFLGPGAATLLLKALPERSSTPAAALLPDAAAANRNVFYHRNGSAVSVGELYSRFAAKIGTGPAGAVANPAPSGTAASAAILGGLLPRAPGAAPLPLYNALVLTALELIGGHDPGGDPAAAFGRHRTPPATL